MKKIFLLFVSFFLLLSFQQCAVSKSENQKKVLKKALKKDTLSVADFLKSVEVRKPQYNDTATLNTFRLNLN